MLSNAVDAAREQDPSQVVTVGDLTSQARGTGARKSAGKPEWYQFPFWAVTPLIHRLARRDRIQGVTEYALVVKDLVEDMANWQRGNNDALEEAALGALALLSYEEKLGTPTLRGLVPVVRVLEFGAKKYAVGNWTRGMQWSVCFNSAMSHLTKLLAGMDKDEESGLSHVAHFACNVFFLLAYRDIYPEGDDRLPGFREGGVKTETESRSF
jgi:hypothetical protein